MGYHCILIVAVRVSMKERLLPAGPKKLGAMCRRPLTPAPGRACVQRANQHFASTTRMPVGVYFFQETLVEKAVNSTQQNPSRQHSASAAEAKGQTRFNRTRYQSTANCCRCFHPLYQQPKQGHHHHHHAPSRVLSHSGEKRKRLHSRQTEKQKQPPHAAKSFSSALR
jgi:hypothetical protein